jgi:hypothetical protein
MNALLVAAEVSAAVDPAKVKPGWIALVIVLLMGLATFLLWRSMNRQLKKVDFDDGSRPQGEGTAQAENGDQQT